MIVFRARRGVKLEHINHHKEELSLQSDNSSKTYIMMHAPHFGIVSLRLSLTLPIRLRFNMGTKMQRQGASGWWN